jgi:hypothetical protein
MDGHSLGEALGQASYLQRQILKSNSVHRFTSE